MKAFLLFRGEVVGRPRSERAPGRRRISNKAGLVEVRNLGRIFFNSRRLIARLAYLYRQDKAREVKSTLKPAGAWPPTESWTPLFKITCLKLGGEVKPMVANETKCITAAPSPSMQITRRRGRAKDMPRAICEA